MCKNCNFCQYFYDFFSLSIFYHRVVNINNNSISKNDGMKLEFIVLHNGSCFWCRNSIQMTYKQQSRHIQERRVSMEKNQLNLNYFHMQIESALINLMSHPVQLMTFLCKYEWIVWKQFYILINYFIIFLSLFFRFVQKLLRVTVRKWKKNGMEKKLWKVQVEQKKERRKSNEMQNKK